MKELSTIRTILRKESKEEEDYKCCSFNGECGMMSNHRFVLCGIICSLIREVFLIGYHLKTFTFSLEFD